MSARAIEQREGLDLADHRYRIGTGQWCHADRDIPQHLDEGAAQPEHHDRPEDLIVAHAENAFDAARDHRREQGAVDACSRFGRTSAGGHRVEGFDGVARANDTQPHTTDLGLVQDVGRDHFDRKRRTRRGGSDRARLGGPARQADRHGRHACLGEQGQ